MKRKSLVVAGIAGLLFAFPGYAMADSGDARVRVIHASPDAPTVDVLVNDSVAIEDLSFGSVTDYVPLGEGTYSIKVRPANSDGPDVISTSVNLEGGKDYTVAAVNPLASISAEVYEDQNFLNNKNSAKLRVFHLSPGAPAVDVALKGGAVLLGNLSYKEVSEYLTLNPGTYDLEVRVAGTNTVDLDIPGVTVDKNKVYQVYAVGVVGGSPEFGVRVSINDAINAPVVERRFIERAEKFEKRAERMREKFEQKRERFEKRHEKFLNRWESRGH
jgi:hypothetical protein